MRLPILGAAIALDLSQRSQNGAACLLNNCSDELTTHSQPLAATSASTYGVAGERESLTFCLPVACTKNNKLNERETRGKAMWIAPLSSCICGMCDPQKSSSSFLVDNGRIGRGSAGVQVLWRSTYASRNRSVNHRAAATAAAAPPPAGSFMTPSSVEARLVLARAHVVQRATKCQGGPAPAACGWAGCALPLKRGHSLSFRSDGDGRKWSQTPRSTGHIPCSMAAPGLPQDMASGRVSPGDAAWNEWNWTRVTWVDAGRKDRAARARPSGSGDEDEEARRALCEVRSHGVLTAWPGRGEATVVRRKRRGAGP